MKSLSCGMRRCSSLAEQSRRIHRDGNSDQIENFLLVAFVTKALSESGTRCLDDEQIHLSETVVLQILHKAHLETGRKIEFFKWCSRRGDYRHSACAYSVMLQSLCCKGYLDQVQGFLGMMRTDGVIVGSRTFKLVFDAFVRAGSFESALQVLDFMEEGGVSIDPDMYNSIITALVRKKQLGFAVSLLCKLVEASFSDGGGSHGRSLSSCNLLLAALKKAEMREEFERVFHKLRATGFAFNTWGYNICIHAFGSWDDLRTSLTLFMEMKEKGEALSSCRPDLCTYNSLIHVLCLAGKTTEALKIYDDLKVSGHDPDIFTYRVLVRGCCRVFMIDDAEKVFHEMEDRYLAPDTAVCNSLLDGLLKGKKVMDACKLFEKMVCNGLKPSCWTHNILIDGLCKNGRAQAAGALFYSLKKRGASVDAITYSIVILQLCREGQLEEALNLVEEMDGRGFVVDIVTITSLLIAFHKHRMWDGTERLMKRVRDGSLLLGVLQWQADMEASLTKKRSRARDNTSMFPCQVNPCGTMPFPRAESRTHGTCVHASEGEERLSSSSYLSSNIDPWSPSPYLDALASDQMKQNGHTRASSHGFSLRRGRRVQSKAEDLLDIDMVNTYLSIFLAKGKLSMACRLFETLRNTGGDPVSYTYNSIANAFVKRAYFNEVWGVLNEMGEKLCPGDIATYNVIIHGLGKMGRADVAGHVLAQLVDEGGYLDVVMYNTLINVLGKAGRMEEAKALFDQMKQSGVSPDTVTYNTLIEVHGRVGQVREARLYLKMMLDANCVPDHVTDTILDSLAKEVWKTGASQKGTT